MRRDRPELERSRTSSAIVDGAPAIALRRGWSKFSCEFSVKKHFDKRFHTRLNRYENNYIVFC